MECHSNHLSDLDTLAVRPLEVFVELCHQNLDLVLAFAHAFPLLSLLKVSLLLLLTNFVNCLDMFLLSKRVCRLSVTFLGFFLLTLFRILAYNVRLNLWLLLVWWGYRLNLLAFFILHYWSGLALIDREILNTKLWVVYRYLRSVPVVLVITRLKEIRSVTHNRICIHNLIIVFWIQCLVLQIMQLMLKVRVTLQYTVLTLLIYKRIILSSFQRILFK